MRRLRVLTFTLLIVAIVVPVLAACGTGGMGTGSASGIQALQIQRVPVEGGGSYTDVSAAGLASMLESNDFPLVNVHVPYEGEIDGTDLFVPFDEIELNLDKLPTDRSAKLVIYCRSGGMSAIAARTLVQLGYTDVWNLDGGMIAWAEAGYQLVDEGR